MNRFFARIARATSGWAGSPYGFLFAAGFILVWAVWGPFVGYSDGWQLVANTFTTLVTFLMTFLIQATQNSDSSAIHAKLDAFIAASDRVSNRLMGIEKED